MQPLQKKVGGGDSGCPSKEQSPGHTVNCKYRKARWKIGTFVRIFMFAYAENICGRIHTLLMFSFWGLRLGQKGEFYLSIHFCAIWKTLC